MNKQELENELKKYKKAIQLIDAEIGDEYGDEIFESLMNAFDNPNEKNRRNRDGGQLSKNCKSWAKSTYNVVNDILDY